MKRKMLKGVLFLISSIVFDVDDTIYDQQQPFRQAINRVFPLVMDEDMHQLYIRFRHHSDERFPLVMSNEWTLTYMRSFRISESLKDLDYPHITEEEGLRFQAIYEEELDNITMHPEVTRTLDYLAAQNVPMGIITNGPTDHQYKKIKQLNLEKWIDSDKIIISQSTGFQKPEKEIFDLAARQFAMIPEETLYVGDSFENDIVGAHGANWYSLWFNHRERKIPDGEATIYDFELSSFDQLPETIERMF